MRVVMLFDADPEMPDPERGHPEGVHAYEEITEGTDCFIVWREWGEQFEGGYRNHTITQGIWENATQEQVDEAIAALELPE